MFWVAVGFWAYGRKGGREANRKRSAEVIEDSAAALGKCCK